MIKKVIADIRRMETVSELLDYIPHKVLEKVSYALLCILCALPLFSMLDCAIFGERIDDSGIALVAVTYQYNWASLVKIIGLLGLIIGAVALSKSVLEYRRREDSVKNFLRKYPVHLLLAGLLLWSTISCVLSNNIQKSFLGDNYRQEGLVMYFAYYGIFALAYLLYDERRRRDILELLPLLALPVAAGIILENEQLRAILNFRYAEHASPFMNINHAGYYLCVAIMCAAANLAIAQKKWNKLLLWGAVFGFLSAALLINSSLGPYLAVIAGLIIMLIVGLVLKKDIWKRVVIIGLIFVIVTGIYALSTDRLFKDTERLASDATAITEDDEAGKAHAGSGRWPLWMAAVDFIREKPVFGYGPDNLGEQYAARNIELDRPHCVPLQIAASLGISALILYLAALTVYIVLFFKKGRGATVFELMLFSIGAAYVISSLVGNSMFYTTPYFCLIWGMALRLKSAVNSRDKNCSIERSVRML